MHTRHSPRYLVLLLLPALLLSACASQETETSPDPTAEAPSPASPELRAAPAGAAAYIISPVDGATVESPFLVQFGLTGMGVAPAAVQSPSTGHHHLLIDVDELPPLDQPLPTTDNIRHFGAGQTETVLDLPPGSHTLQLVLGNFAHTPHDPPVVSEKITIEVIE